MIMTPCFNEKSILTRIDSVSNYIKVAYPSTKDTVILGVLNGGFIFTSDLSRGLFDKGVDLETVFCKVSSYKDNKQLDTITVDYLGINPKDKHILIVDDIYETGKTLQFLKTYLYNLGALSVKTITVICRGSIKDAEHLDWCLFEYHQDDWFYGYGMDNKQLNRNARHIFLLK